MKPFLSQLASHLYQIHQNNIEQILFVFPSRRAGVFFQQYLAKHADTPFFAPVCCTISELFAQLAPDYEIEDRMALLLRLYQCYTQVSGSKESFDSFMGFGETLLKDFNDIDNYLVNATAIYSNLADLNALNDDSYLSKEQQEALSTFLNYTQNTQKEKQANTGRNWQLLGKLYQTFTQSLLAEKLAYDGLLHRKVCEMEELSLPHCDQVVFIGFNALDGATRALFSKLKAANKADFYWDYQSDYLQDKANKAHYFANQNLEQFPSKHPLSLDTLQTPNIQTIAIPSAIGQTKYVSQILQGVAANTNTALVLADEQLLVPMLYALPNTEDHPIQSHANITMGYPLQQTNIIKFITDYIQLHTSVTEDGFYHAHVAALLQHPYIKETYPIDITQKELASLLKHLYIAPQALQEVFAEIEDLKSLFTQHEDNSNLLKELYTLITQISIGYYIEKELLQATHYQLVKMRNTLDAYPKIKIQPQTLISLISQALSKLSYSFIGKPTQGVQVMGILETRCLDFEQVIITSFNEGIYPQKDNTNTYIPYNIRMHFGLPTTEHQDAIYAYNFYRLIQRAKQVYLLYDTRSDGKGNAGEISRFAQQLTFLYKHRIQPVQVNCSTQICAISPVSIKQDKEIIQEKVKHYLTQSGLAPTALNTFINCPLQFYFEKIEKLTINKPLSIELEANQIGNVFHYVMEHLYKEFENQEISKEILEEKIINRQEKLDLLLKRAMIKEIHQLQKEEEIDNLMEVYTIKGIMQLTMEVIKEYVLACVKQDIAITPFVYVGGEKNYHRVLENENPAYNIKIKGTIDRIDSRNDGIHIIDYKTSNVKEDKSNNQALINIADLFDPDSKVEKKNELLQVCFYKLLTAQEFTGKNVSCHLYHVKRMFTAPDEFQALSIKILPDNWEETFMEHLNQKIQDMYNVDILTKPTDRIKSCKYCDFKDLCGR